MKTLVTVLFAALSLAVVSCGGSSGVCVAHYSTGDQCYDCWSQELCEESSNREWVDDIESCDAAGYNHYIGNECGYTMF